jgi:hypothetical protein
MFLGVVSLLWGAGLAGGHLLTKVELLPGDWQVYAGARVFIQIVPALLLGIFILLFVRGRTTPKLRLILAGVLLAVGVFASFGALRALVSGALSLQGVVEEFESKSWRDKNGVDRASASLVVKQADGDEASLTASGEFLSRIERAGCVLGAHADIAYLPGLEVVFSAQCQKPESKP